MHMVMNGNCIFCKISNNQIPSYKIYEDNDFIVILDIHPVNPGHLLCITRQHVESYYDLEDKTYSKLMLLAKKMSLLIKKTVNPAKVTIHTSGIGNKHTHIHVIPVNSMYDIIPREVLEKIETNPTEDELRKTHTRLLGNLENISI